MTVNFKKLYRLRIFYTIYFCFRYLPFKQARHIPILFYSRARIDMQHGGRILLGDDFQGRVSLGDYQLNFAHGKEYTVITNRGTIHFEQGEVFIRSGNIWYVQGKVQMGRNVLIGNNSQLSCYKNIRISSNCRITHECQIRDTNFHHIRDVVSGVVKPILRPIFIGSCCWIGNRTSVMPGTVLPNFTIVGSNSLLNKDYSITIAERSLIAGIPAKLICANVERLSFVDSSLDLEIQQKELNGD
jgi:acetyltransferase-like isoleucine patch superfamily enzyme